VVEENCVELGFEREEKARRSKWIRCMSKTQDPGNPDFHFARKRARHQFMNSLNFDQLIDLLKNEYCRCVDSDGTRVLAWRAGPDWTGLDWTGMHNYSVESHRAHWSGQWNYEIQRFNIAINTSYLVLRSV